jgi:hypothetical protein
MNSYLRKLVPAMQNTKFPQRRRPLVQWERVKLITSEVGVINTSKSPFSSAWRSLAFCLTFFVGMAATESIYGFEVTPINFPNQLNGTLSHDDFLLGEAYIDVFEFTLNTETEIEIGLESSEFNTLLYLAQLQMPDKSLLEVWTDNNSGESSNSLMSRTLSEGTYWVGVSSAVTYEIGAYSLKISGQAEETAFSELPPFCSTPVNSETNSEESLGLVGDADKRWPNGSTLKVAMNFEGTTKSEFSLLCDDRDTEETCQEKVKNLIMEQASEWSKHGNISFQYTRYWDSAEIRIRFDRGDGANSYVGTDAQEWPRYKKTMNLDISRWKSDRIKATIIHEFGHAIGLEHEHKRPDTPYQLDEEELYEFHLKNDGWDQEMTNRNVLRPLNFGSRSYLRTEYDDTSIMRYYLLRDFVVNDSICPSDDPYYCVEPNNELSDLDKEGISLFYPYERPYPAYDFIFRNDVACVFYEHRNRNLDGDVMELKGGYVAKDLGKEFGLWDTGWKDEISSVWVQDGYIAKLYHEDYFEGGPPYQVWGDGSYPTPGTLHGNGYSHNLPSSWDDATDSLKCEHVPYNYVFVSNNSDRGLYIALIYVDSYSNDWISQPEEYGALLAGEKILLLGKKEEMNNPYVYLHAHDRDGNAWHWDEADSMLLGEAYGEDRKFFPIYLGESASHYTITLNEDDFR